MNLFELSASLSLDSSDYDKGLEDSEKKSSTAGSKIASAMGTIGKGILTAVGTASTAVAGLVTASVNAYSSYEQLTGGVEKLFGDASDQLVNLANSAYLSAGMSANDYMDTVTSFSASLISSLGGDTEKAVSYADQAVTDMSDNANMFGTDIESIQNAYAGFAKQNYTMLDNLKLGYAGSKEGMEQLLEDATALSGVEYDVSNYADVTQAIHVIQESMGIAGTTAKEAMGTIEGSMNALKASWTNVLTGMADDTYDFDGAIDGLVTSAEAVVSNILPRVETALNGIGTLIENVVPVVADELPGILESVLPQILSAGVSLIDSLLSGITSALPGLVPILLSTVSNIATTILSQLPAILSAGIQIIESLLDGISQEAPVLIPQIISCILELASTIIDNLDTILDGVISVVEAVADSLINDGLPMILEKLPDLILGLVDFLNQSGPEILTAVIGIITSLLEQAPTIIEMLISIIPQLIVGLTTSLISSIPQLITAGFTLLTSLITDLPQIIIEIVKAIPQIVIGIVNGFKEAWPQIKESGKELLTSLMDGLGKVGGVVGPVVKKVWKYIKLGFETEFKAIKTIGKNLITGLWNGISDKVSWIKQKIQGFSESVLSTIKGFFGIHSPSTEMAWVGEMLDRGLIQGIGSLADDVVAEATGLSGNVLDAFNGDVSIGTTSTASSGSSPIDAITDLLNSYLPQLANTQIVTDTGVLVGAIAPKMDTALGRIQSAKNRGR